MIRGRAAVPASARVGGILLLLVVLFCFPGAWLYDTDPHEQGDLLTERYLAPSPDHPFGTDKFGRDVLSRVMHGGRVSLLAALSVVLMSALIGALYGAVSGFCGARADHLMMRTLDFFLALPVVYVLLALVTLIPVTLPMLILVLALSSWMDIARVTRAEVLAAKRQEFVAAVKGLGYRPSRVLLRHVLPNSIGPALILLPMKIGEIVLLEAALSFLGIGIPPPSPTWGNLIHDGYTVLASAWWLSFLPGALLALTVIGFNLVAEGMRQKLSPESNGSAIQAGAATGR